MIYTSDLNSLLGEWKDRLSNNIEQPYKDAVNDCIYDLKCLIERDFTEEIISQEIFEQEMADNYLSTIEAHDRIYN